MSGDLCQQHQKRRLSSRCQSYCGTKLWWYYRSSLQIRLDLYFADFWSENRFLPEELQKQHRLSYRHRLFSVSQVCVSLQWWRSLLPLNLSLSPLKNPFSPHSTSSKDALVYPALYKKRFVERNVSFRLQSFLFQLRSKRSHGKAVGRKSNASR
jgi:hypothetical protein